MPPLATCLPDRSLLSEGQVGSRERMEKLVDRFMDLQQSAENECRRKLWFIVFPGFHG